MCSWLLSIFTFAQVNKSKTFVWWLLAQFRTVYVHTVRCIQSVFYSYTASGNSHLKVIAVFKTAIANFAQFYRNTFITHLTNCRLDFTPSILCPLCIVHAFIVIILFFIHFTHHIFCHLFYFVMTHLVDFSLPKHETARETKDEIETQTINFNAFIIRLWHMT